ncbi:MAG: nuclear transport factor 2 family protein [Acidobacteriota bacterium]
MRTVLAAVGGLVLGWAAATAASQASPALADDETRRAVAAVKEAIVVGHRTRDRGALDALYAPDYTAIDARGTLRRKADLLRSLPTDPEMLEGGYTLTAARRWGPIVVASGHGRMVYRNADGTTRLSEYDSVNVFEWRDGRWLYAAAFLP